MVTWWEVSLAICVLFFLAVLWETRIFWRSRR